MSRFFLPLIIFSSLLLNSQAQTNSPSPGELLAYARSAMHFDVVAGRILHMYAMTTEAQPYQSDRSYPPFFSDVRQQEIWFDISRRLQRTTSTLVSPGDGPDNFGEILDDGVNALAIREEKRTPIHRRQAESRYLNPWAVVADWSDAKDVRLAGTELFRDYPRVVLSRITTLGEQRLYLDPKTGFPVKLDFTEPHYLWGQRHIEFIWSTWILSQGINVPGAAFRIADGEVESSQTIGKFELTDPQTMSGFSVPGNPAEPPSELPRFLQPLPPMPARIADNVWLLGNPGYNEMVALLDNEIYLFDATQGEERARQDDALIQNLFPGSHTINVIVTDLAWPHIAGVRYWVSRGANIIGHSAAQKFLPRVIDNKWIYVPDGLEKQRAKQSEGAKFHFKVVGEKSVWAHGTLRIIPIDGIGSEVALMGYIPASGVLWASDYVQTLSAPSLYAHEVIDAVRRSTIEPRYFAAEHVSAHQWTELLAAQKAK